MGRESLTSVIVVSWNTLERTIDCIDSLFCRNRGLELEVIVVDNASMDGTPAAVRRRFSQVRLLANRENVGFAKAVNQGLAAASGDLLVVMNADTALLSEQPFARIRAFLRSHPRVGIVGATLLLPSGAVQSRGRKFQDIPTLFKMHLLFKSAPFWSADAKPCPAKPVWVDYVDGAFLAFRREVFEDVGPMDESHFLYAEDMEWCSRAHIAGWQVVVLPDVQVRHYQGSSASQHLARTLVHNAVNVSHFVGVIYGWSQAHTAWVILLAGMLLRIPLAVARRSGQVGQYWEALRTCLSLSRNLRQVLKDRWPAALLGAEHLPKPAGVGEGQ